MIRFLKIIGPAGFLSLLASSGYSASGPLASTGLTVDPTQRASVVAFWNRYYESEESVEAIMEWSGSYGSTCNPGSNSPAYTEAIERRINFYRALAGVGGDTLTNTGSTVVIGGSDPYKPSAGTTKVSAAQRAALMFSYAGQLSHNPPPSLPYSCWSSSAWNAAKNSNLALGFCGLEAIDAYMRENDPTTLSIWSSGAGHRRWLLKQGVTDFASGDVPGDGGSRMVANVLYVFPASSELVAVPPRFAPWPSAGFFPDALMAKQWSLSHPDADFTSATVTMTDSVGVPVATTLVDRTTLGLGDPAIIWSVPGPVALTSVDADTTYQVTVSGIELDGGTVSHSYSVTVIDPDVIPESLELVGTASPPITGANYFFDPVADAEEHRLVVTRTGAVDWTAGAEDGEQVPVIDQTSPVYDLRSTGYAWAGNKSYRLIFPSQSEFGPQAFAIDRTVTGRSGAEMRYRFRRGWMTSGMRFEVEMSAAGGPWVGVDSVNGNFTNSPDSAFSQRTVALPADVPVRFRFRLVYVSGGLYIASSSPQAGAFVDGVSFLNADWITSESEIPGAPGEEFVRLDPSLVSPSPVVGEALEVSLRAYFGGKPYQTPTGLQVTFVAESGDFAQWLAAEFPLVTGGFEGDHDGDGLSNGLEYAFGLSPVGRSQLPRELTLNGTSLQLSTPLPQVRGDVLYQMQVSEDLSTWDAAGTSVEHSGGQLIGTAPAPAGKGFARWKVTQP